MRPVFGSVLLEDLLVADALGLVTIEEAVSAIRSSFSGI